MSNMDDDIIIESSSSGPATPLPSNPGTPRSIDTDVRNTPPLGMPHSQSTSSLQAMAMANSAMTPSGSSSSLQAMVHGTGVTTPASSVHQMQQQQMHQKSHIQPQSKYGQLLAVIEDMGKDIRPTYAGSKTSAERLKRGIVHARILVRECLMECERAART